jgi:hypothetical protein
LKTPNYHDFYEVALVPIGSNDQRLMLETNSYYPESGSTHWLIAVEGVQLPQAKIYFHWKVSIYHANGEGDFDWKKPYYCSANMKMIDHAIKLAHSLAAASKKDELASNALLEKIS